MSEIAPRDEAAQAIARVLIEGDLSALNPEQKVTYYLNVCESLGLNSLTRPFDYIRLSGKLVLYANKNCTQQLAKIHGISIIDFATKQDGNTYTVIVKAQDKTGRTDYDMGIVSLDGLSGEAVPNVKMKAGTKAKRRVVLSICGLGMLDETEVETIQGVERVEAEPEDRAQALADRIADQPKYPVVTSDNPREKLVILLENWGFDRTKPKEMSAAARLCTKGSYDHQDKRGPRFEGDGRLKNIHVTAAIDFVETAQADEVAWQDLFTGDDLLHELKRADEGEYANPPELDESDIPF